MNNLNIGTQQEIRDRYLLTPETEDFPKSAILVTAGGAMGDDPCEVRLMLIAPGLSSLDNLREQLSAWLGQSLPTVDEDWACQVGIEPHYDHSEPQIVVKINDASLCDASVSASCVLDAARTFLTPAAMKSGRRIITLQAKQRFVPLDFRSDKYAPAKVELTLPDELDIVATRLPNFSYDNVWQEAWSALQLGLATAICKFNRVSTSIAMRDGKLVITATFDTRHGFPQAQQLNALENVIAQTVARHVRYAGGFFTRLVFGQASLHQDADDVGYFREEQEY